MASRALKKSYRSFLRTQTATTLTTTKSTIIYQGAPKFAKVILCIWMQPPDLWCHLTRCHIIFKIFDVLIDIGHPATLYINSLQTYISNCWIILSTSLTPHGVLGFWGFGVFCEETVQNGVLPSFKCTVCTVCGCAWVLPPGQRLEPTNVACSW